MSRKGFVAFAIFGVLVSSSARASTLIDLTTAGSFGSGTAAVGGLFGVVQIDPQSTGTGVIDSFLRVDNNKFCVGTGSGCEEGYNTDQNPAPMDDLGGNFTRSLLLSDVPIVNISGTAYRMFLLDVNQDGANPLIDLNQIQFWQGTADPTGATLTAGTATNPPAIASFAGGTFTNVFQMSATGSGTPNFDIRLNYNLNSGSGSGDMLLFVPNADFVAANGQYVVLFTQFGTPPGVNGINDGFEEWAIVKPFPVISPFCTIPGECDIVTTPEPASLLLFGTGLAAVARQVRRRKRRQ